MSEIRVERAQSYLKICSSKEHARFADAVSITKFWCSFPSIRGLNAIHSEARAAAQKPGPSTRETRVEKHLRNHISYPLVRARAGVESAEIGRSPENETIESELEGV